MLGKPRGEGAVRHGTRRDARGHWHPASGTSVQGPSPGRRQPRGDVAGAQPLVLAVCAGLECREQAVTAQPSPVHVCTGNV